MSGLETEVVAVDCKLGRAKDHGTRLDGCLYDSSLVGLGGSGGGCSPLEASSCLATAAGGVCVGGDSARERGSAWIECSELASPDSAAGSTASDMRSAK